MYHTQNRGFTIVELLVIVVVIAILAAIITVIYNGIEARAYQSSLSSSVSVYAKALMLYKVDTGNFPPSDWSCLGRIEDYPAENGFGQGVCLTNGSTYNEVWRQDVHDILAKYIDNFPSPRYQGQTDDQGNRVRGLEYDQVTSGFNTATITFYLTGDTSCPIGQKVAYTAAWNTTRCSTPLY